MKSCLHAGSCYASSSLSSSSSSARHPQPPSPSTPICHSCFHKRWRKHPPTCSTSTSHAFASLATAVLKSTGRNTPYLLHLCLPHLCLLDHGCSQKHWQKHPSTCSISTFPAFASLATAVLKSTGRNTPYLLHLRLPCLCLPRHGCSQKRWRKRPSICSTLPVASTKVGLMLPHASSPSWPPPRSLHAPQLLASRKNAKHQETQTHPWAHLEMYKYRGLLSTRRSLPGGCEVCRKGVDVPSVWHPAPVLPLLPVPPCPPSVSALSQIPCPVFGRGCICSPLFVSLPTQTYPVPRSFIPFSWMDVPSIGRPGDSPAQLLESPQPTLRHRPSSSSSSSSSGVSGSSGSNSSMIRSRIRSRARSNTRSQRLSVPHPPSLLVIRWTFGLCHSYFPP